MSRSGESNCGRTSIDNPTDGVGAGSNSSVGSNSSHNVSGSASNSASLSTAVLTSLFECPICFDYALPPILQCEGGHLVCSTCRPKLRICPTCRRPLRNIRNLAMEKIASAVSFPCKYSSSGCPKLMLPSVKVEHEELCEFRPYTCPCPGNSCNWEGGLELVLEHLKVAHNSITTLEGEEIIFLATNINHPGTVDWVMMQSCFGKHFMVRLEKREKYQDHHQFFATVLLIGSRKQCDNFIFRLELNGYQKRLVWEAKPRSIHEEVFSTEILNSDGLVFETNTAQMFVNDNNLEINVTISTNV